MRDPALLVAEDAAFNAVATAVLVPSHLRTRACLPLASSTVHLHLIIVNVALYCVCGVLQGDRVYQLCCARSDKWPFQLEAVVSLLRASFSAFPPRVVFNTYGLSLAWTFLWFAVSASEGLQKDSLSRCRCCLFQPGFEARFTLQYLQRLI